MDIDGENIAGLRLLDAAAQNASELPSDNVNISDVLEALQRADPSYEPAVAESALEPRAAPAAGYGAAMAQRPATRAQVHIVEQPAAKALRFRYECEGRSAGSIPGANSTPENRTYPTIRISNFSGKATIVASCITKDDFKAHPHNLVGRDGCKNGVFTMKLPFSPENSEYQFRNLGIQCVKRRDIQDALQKRMQLRVDPFRKGFDHRNNPQSIDLNAVRIAFQVFLHVEGDRPGQEGQLLQLTPVYSDVIYDKKAMCDLQIMRASHCSGPVRGGSQIILLCEKVTREDTVVKFYQQDASGNITWEAPANTVLVHKQVAIVFETPPYNPPQYDPRLHRGQIIAKFRLYRTSDNQHSNSLDFEYIPEFIEAKKRKAVMSDLYNAESYNLVQNVKNEPNLTPPHNMYQQAAAVYADPHQAQAAWGGAGYGAGGAGEAWRGAGQYAYGAGSPYGHSPAPSPLGELSPHLNLPSPMSPHLQPPYLHHHAQQAAAQAQPMAGAEQMETGGSTSFSALLEAGSQAPLPPAHELFSLASLDGQDNLSDSLKNLSTQDLLPFRQ